MLDKRYDHKKVEEGKYEKWKKEGYFTAGDISKSPFSMVIPPPNVTGKLHLGHAWNTTIQDITARYKKLKGFDVMWLAGMDHAGIATQAKVEEKLRSQGISRYDLGREKFLEKAWEWKVEYAANIHEQWAKMGLMLDYSRERFTLDESLNKAVVHVFKTLYDKGLIYRGERIINFDPELKTALSNIEVEYSEDKGKFYYFRYPIVDSKESLVVATTRPETMFGDVAVFVNPKDKRYKHLIGKFVINPANEEPLPIMGDDYVDIEFGTGAMKCTPAHDPNDFALSEKYSLKRIICMDLNAKMNENCGKYQGMDRYECREKLVEQIEKDGRLIKIEDIVHTVGHSERSHTVVEPMLMKQWFVKMRPLAEQALNKSTVNFVPARFNNTFRQWMENVDDWCISRQLWWGHRIPAYYNKNTGEILVSETPITDPNYVQDEDVLDTWFSSALWPFATLGWPDTNNPDFKRYFPNSLLVTAYDIIFFWVSRMIFDSLEFTKESPFKDCLIHGLIRDSQGRKMSKSLGNGIDPIDVIDQYGVDALRYFLTTGSAPGQDIRYIEEKVQSSSNYLNKIWNSARYVLESLGEGFKPVKFEFSKLNKVEQDILVKLNKTIKNVDSFMDKYEYSMASSYLYNFVYDDFCSAYLEMSKVSLSQGDEEYKNVVKSVLLYILKNIIIMIYPFAPFIGEELYLALPEHKKSIMIETYPAPLDIPENEIVEVSNLYKMIQDIRNYKVSNKLAPNYKLKFIVEGETFPGFDTYLARFSFAKEIILTKKAESKGMRYAYQGVNLYIEDEISKEDLEAKKAKDIAYLKAEIARSEGMLNNPNFVQKAPQEKVELERKKLAEFKKKLAELN